jgi:hypothetical protein
MNFQRKGAKAQRKATGIVSLPFNKPIFFAPLRLCGK